MKKHDFYSGHSGGSSSEVSLFIASVVLFYTSKTICLSITETQIKNSLVAFLIDFVLFIVPITLCITLFEQFIYQIFYAYLFVVIIFVLYKIVHVENLTWKHLKLVMDSVAYNNESRSPAITFFRYVTTVISCVCILAVDFNIFPRRFAKCETFGSSLMDTGVGYFVSSNAFVCPNARNNCKVKSASKFTRVIKTIISTWPLLALGFARLISLKLVNYHEHVSEYGVHWNFFFTLAVVKIFASIILMTMSVISAAIFSLVLMAIYEILLVHYSFNLTEILLNDNRDGIVMANKEGLASCIGYLAIYLPSVFLGQKVLELFSKKISLIESIKQITFFMLTAVFLYFVLQFSASNIQSVSRRLCNFSFVIWQLAMNSFFLSIILAMQMITTILVQMNLIPFHAVCDQFMKTPEHEKEFVNHRCLSNAVNRNQMFYFLLSNLATGLINMSIVTVDANPFTSIVILLVYSFSILGIIWTLHIKNITLKWW